MRFRLLVQHFGRKLCRSRERRSRSCFAASGNISTSTLVQKTMAVLTSHLETRRKLVRFGFGIMVGGTTCCVIVLPSSAGDFDHRSPGTSSPVSGVGREDAENQASVCRLAESETLLDVRNEAHVEHASASSI